MKSERARELTNGREFGPGPIVYWMSRDQRSVDNWALLYAQSLAIEHSRPLVVVFTLAADFLGATARAYEFMFSGLSEVENDLRAHNIPFVLLVGDPSEKISEFADTENVGAIIVDFDPLRIKQVWRNVVANRIKIPFYEVDTHNLVPAWVVSQKQEFGAYPFRNKLLKLIPDFLEDFPKLRPHPIEYKKNAQTTDWAKVRAAITFNDKVKPVDWIIPGQSSARKSLSVFLDRKLVGYSVRRNNPTLDAQSDLSPYLHFGHIAAQRIAIEMLKAKAPKQDRDDFFEELIVRRELADNFCYYNQNYDSVKCFPDWAVKTHEAHKFDLREYVYDLKQFEEAKTHDPLWNAAQMEMVKRGKMHGYMRMYWAKKIFEWTNSVDDAIKIAIFLNDKYELDGRDPNGYAGIAWSIGGVHDRAWFDRPIYGQIRYMNYNGCKSKFDVDAYIARWQ